MDRAAIARTAALGLLFVAATQANATEPPRTEGLDPLTEEVAVVLTAAQEAFKARIDAAEVPALSEFYAAYDYAPIWTMDRAAAFIEALGDVTAHGLPAGRYDRAGLAELLATRDSDPNATEVTFSLAFINYARDIGSGILEPRQIDRELSVRPPRPDGALVLAGLAAADDPAAYVADLAPSHPDYAKLQAERLRLLDIIEHGDWGETVSTRTLKPGAEGEAVTAVRARLGRINGEDYGDSPVFDDALVDVVKEFQIRHGLNDDAVLGPKTLEQLNANAVDRLKQVLVNLERQRWLNVERGDRHIYVNQADFSVSVIDEGEVTFWSRTVIGKNGHRTQEFNDTMTHMVINPTWHVPRSIATEEMLPKLKRNPGALGGTFDVMTRNGTRVNPAYVNFRQYNQSNFPFIVKQRPGTSNALGRVKFMFPNQYNIYLHDTPSKSLFNRDARAYSHGCVRVQKPFEFAYVLLGAQSDNPEGLFQSYLNGGRERQLNLETPVPIYLTYQSAWVDNFGTPQYRADIYGRDGRVFRALENAGVALGAVEG